MVRIRLRRVGKKKQASYRIVVIDREAPATGRAIENIGHFNPRTDPETFVIKEERALYWLGVGAKPSDAVLRLLEKSGIMDKFARIKAGESIEPAEEATVPAEEVDVAASDEVVEEEE